MFSDNGLIHQAEYSKGVAANEAEYETQRTLNLVGYMNEMMGNSGEIAGPDDPGTEPDDPNPDEPDPDAPYVDDVLPVAPTVGAGMIPVKYDETLGWVRTTETDPEWYNYSNEDKAGGAKAKYWANVVLSEAEWTTNGDKQVLDETKPYSMLVWIPRYAYQITSQYHQAGTGGGNINIKFVDTNNQTKDKKETIGTAYPAYSTGSGMEQYVVHPAFTWGDTNGTKTELAGIWVGKFETSNQNCTTAESSGQYNGTERKLMIKGNVTSWRLIEIDNIFSVCISINDTEDNIYGLETDSKEDPHLMKNTEWGAVAYLAQNATYGKGLEVSMNTNSSYLTGGGNYKVNLGQSTNENITGIYDMSGGAWEHVAAYAVSGNGKGASLVSAASRYKDVYSSYDYNTATLPASHFGDALYETSASSKGWNSDSVNFPESKYPFLLRGSSMGGSITGGLFCLTYGTGGVYGDSSFRLVIPVLSK